MEIAILGAGNGGQATAAHMSLLRHRVRLYDRYPSVTAAFAADRRLELKGPVAGEVEIDVVTNEIDEALVGAELILVTVPGFALAWVAEQMALHLADGQIVVLHPGGTGGALETRCVWSALNMQADVVLAETESLVYACRISASGRPDVKAIKQDLSLAALPADGAERAFTAFSSLYPQATRATSVLATSLANMNAVIHPAVALLNAGIIDRRLAGFDFYRDGVSNGVSRLLLAVDGERMAIARAYGVEHSSYDAWVARHYGITGSDPVDLFKRLADDVYQGIGTPESLDSRYIAEDVPMALVPLEVLAEVAEVETPAIGSIINLCSIINAVDYRTNGRTLARLGLDGMTVEEIVAFVQEGTEAVV
jgi:opine dehydrogenase